MKTKSMIRLTAALALMLLFTQCGGKKEMSADDGQMEQASSSDEVQAASEPVFAVDATFQQQVAHAFEVYIKVKDALVASDAGLVKTEAANLKSVIKAMDLKMLTGAALNDWTNYANNLDMALAEMVGSDDIEVQRSSFVDLSDNLYKSIKAYGLGNATAYHDFCPMAFDNQGAYWLSDSKEIRNPYFGDKMLTCGRVTEELK